MNMNIKEKLYNLSKKRYPIYNYFFRKNKKRRLKNRDFTIIANTCMGGLIYHYLDHKFLSPTINLAINDKKQYINFISNLEHYLSLDLKFIERDEKNDFPIGMLDDVVINFVHYKTEEEAESKWNERKQRINYNNIYFLLSDYEGLDKEDMEKLKGLSYNNFEVFSGANATKCCTKKIKRWIKKSDMWHRDRTRKFIWEYEFDYTAFLNKR